MANTWSNASISCGGAAPPRERAQRNADGLRQPRAGGAAQAFGVGDIEPGALARDALARHLERGGRAGVEAPR